MSRYAGKSSAPKKAPRRIATRVDLRPGASPGTLAPVIGSLPATVTVLSIDADRSVSVKRLDGLESLPSPSKAGLRWIRVVGLGAVEPLVDVAKVYDIRRLALETILSPGWRTKVEEHGEFAFFVLQAPPDAVLKRRGDHLGLFCRHGLIVSFEDAPTPLVDALWERIQRDGLPQRVHCLAEFATYLVLDYMVDSFFPHLDEKDELLGELEDSLADHPPRHDDLNRLHQVKHSLITLRRLLSPFKEVGAELARYHGFDATRELKPYYSGLCDHIVQAEELLETYYEVAQSLDEMFQTLLSNRTSDIIRILTIISTIFMPLMFIVGVYGMNFDYMPELRWGYGYPLVLGLMAGVVGAMLWFFRRRNWL